MGAAAPLHDLIAAEAVAREAGGGLSDEARAMAEAVARRHGATVLGILFYGSCLRPPPASDSTAVGPGGVDERILDLYAVVDDLRAANGGWLRALGNRLLPPNVFYLETPFGDGRVRCKYAIVTLAQLERLVAPATLQNYFWGRFCQPTAIVQARDATVRARLLACLAQAVASMVGATAPLLDGPSDARALWLRAFAESYRAELRAEDPERRAAQIHDADRARYAAITGPALVAAGLDPQALPEGRFELRSANAAAARRRWRLRRVLGKTLNALRILKAGLTFDGGLDYLLWKIERHSGVRPRVTPRERRHPLLLSPLIAWRAWRDGAFR